MAPAIGNAFGSAFGNNAGSAFGARLATGLVAGTAAAAMKGGRVAIQQVAVDAFGNVLGNSLARGSVSGGAASAKTSDDPIKALYDLNDGWRGVSAAPTFAEDRALRQAATNPMGLPTYSAASNTAPDFSRVNELLANGPTFEADMSAKDAQSLAVALDLADSDLRAPGVQLAMGPAAAFVGVGGGGAAGSLGAAGGYQSMRPNGIGGPPGYDIRTDMPSGSPGYSGLDPSVGFGAPPSQSESRSWMSNIIGGPTQLGFLTNALEGLVFSTNSGASSIADQARDLGYDRLVKDPPFNSHGQKVFTNGRDFITPDVDQHNGGVWKGFDRRGNRTGTYEANLDRIGK